MNEKRVLGLCAAAYIVWRFIGRTATAALSLRFKISDFRITGFVSGATVVRINLAVQNPTNFAIRLRRLVCWLTMDGKRIGFINQHWAHTIDAGAVVVLPLYIKIQNRALSTVMWNNIRNGNFVDFILGFDGKILCDNAWMPVLLEFPGREILTQTTAQTETTTTTETLTNAETTTEQNV